MPLSGRRASAGSRATRTGARIPHTRNRAGRDRACHAAEAPPTAPACRRRDGSTGVRWAAWSDAGAASSLVTARGVENRFQLWRVPDPPIGPSSIQADVVGTDGTDEERHDGWHQKSLTGLAALG